jgi:nucleoid-associated protein YgaU
MPNQLSSFYGAGSSVQTSSSFGLPTLQNSFGNQAVSSRTASIAAPVASGMTAAFSTKPSGATGGGVSTSNGGGGGGGSTTYTVKPGDTLGNIGYANGTTATALGAANGIQNLNIIHPGQVLTIPHR